MATNTIGGAVRSVRERKKLKKSELARLVGVSPEHISYIERGERNPSVATLIRIADALGVPVTSLTAPKKAS